MKYQNTCAALLAAAFFMLCNTTTAQNTNSLLATTATGNAATHSHFVPWPPIKEIDITTKKRMWEDISLSEKTNQVFGMHNSGKALIDVLIAGVSDGKITAYSVIDDRFSTPLTKDDFVAKFGHTTSLNITKYIIKEDSLLLNTGEVTVRIIGLTPIVSVIAADGTITEQPLFRIFYPDARSYFSQCTSAGSYTWDDVFEHRYFSGKVTRVKVW